MVASHVTLSIPPQPSFARSVRMMAANLAVLCAMNVEEVEDARMAAEEAFVYACATRPDVCDIDFEVSAEGLSMSFSLGDAAVDEDPSVMEQVGLAEVLLCAVSDSYEFSPDGAVLRATKLVGASHGI